MVRFCYCMSRGAVIGLFFHKFKLGTFHMITHGKKMKFILTILCMGLPQFHNSCYE